MRWSFARTSAQIAYPLMNSSPNSLGATPWLMRYKRKTAARRITSQFFCCNASTTIALKMSLLPRINNLLERATRDVLSEFHQDGRCTQAEYQGWSAHVPRLLASLGTIALNGLGNIEDHAGLAQITVNRPVGSAVTIRWQGESRLVSFPMCVEMTLPWRPDRTEHSLVNATLGYAHDSDRDSLHDHMFLLHQPVGTEEGACTAWNYSALASASKAMQHQSTAEQGANTDGDQAAKVATAPSRAGQGTVFIAYKPA